MLTHKPAFITKGRLWAYVTKGTSFPVNELENSGATIHGINFAQGTTAASPKKRLMATDAMRHMWLESDEFIDETKNRSSIERCVIPVNSK